jgi:hypothetical protein
MAGKGFVVGAGVHQLQPAPRNGEGLVQMVLPEQVEPAEMVNQEPEFGHRKPMLLWKRS